MGNLYNAIIAINGWISLTIPAQIVLLFIIAGLSVTQILILAKDYKLRKQLSFSEDRWKVLMHNAPMIVLKLDRHGNILYINTFGATLLGYNRPEELLNQNWLDNFVLHSEIPSLKKLYLEVFNSKLVSPTFKNTIRNKHGQEIAM